MSQRNVIVIRGVSGSGKSSFAELIANPKAICCADDYFTDKNGHYHFDATKLAHAHAFCRDQFDIAIRNDKITNIIIANTNCSQSDYSYYVNRAAKYNIRVTYVVLEKRHDNKDVHNVPEETLNRQYDKLSKSLKLK